MVKIGFHYKEEKRWNELNNDRNKDRAIRPIKRLIRLRSITDKDIPLLPEWAHETYVFAFPDQEAPESWKRYEHWRDEWDILTRDIGERIVELRFDILPEDNAYVVDRAHFADFQFGHSKDRKEAIRRYAHSKVPADAYDGSFKMPELIIKNPIDLARITVTNVFERRLFYKNKQWGISYHFLQPDLLTA